MFLYFSRHKEEARKAGFEHVLDLDLPSDDELEKDLIQLAKEQEKLISELKQAYAEEEDKLGRNIDAGRKAKFDTEMEALAKAMSSSVPATVLENAIEMMREVLYFKILFVFILKCTTSRSVLLMFCISFGNHDWRTFKKRFFHTQYVFIVQKECRKYISQKR